MNVLRTLHSPQQYFSKSKYLWVEINLALTWKSETHTNNLMFAISLIKLILWHLDDNRVRLRASARVKYFYKYISQRPLRNYTLIKNTTN